MFKNFAGAALAIAMVLVLTSAMTFASGGSGGGGGGGGSGGAKPSIASGYILSLDYDTGVMTVGFGYYGLPTMIVVSPKSQLKLNNVNCTLDHLQIGDAAVAQYNRDSFEIITLSATGP